MVYEGNRHLQAYKGLVDRLKHSGLWFVEVSAATDAIFKDPKDVEQKLERGEIYSWLRRTGRKDEAPDEQLKNEVLAIIRGYHADADNLGGVKTHQIYVQGLKRPGYPTHKQPEYEEQTAVIQNS